MCEKDGEDKGKEIGKGIGMRKERERGEETNKTSWRYKDTTQKSQIHSQKQEVRVLIVFKELIRERIKFRNFGKKIIVEKNF